MRACMMFKERANDTWDIIMKAKQMLVVLFFIGQWLLCYTAQTFATLQFVAFIIIISYLYVLNIFFLCAGYFLPSVLSPGCELSVTEQIKWWIKVHLKSIIVFLWLSLCLRYIVLHNMCIYTVHVYVTIFTIIYGTITSSNYGKCFFCNPGFRDIGPNQSTFICKEVNPLHDQNMPKYLLPVIFW